MNRFKKINNLHLRVKKQMPPFTIPKIYLLDGMVSQFLIGCTSFMVLESSTNAKFVVISVIGVVVLLKCTFNNGVTLTA